MDIKYLINLRKSLNYLYFKSFKEIKFFKKEEQENKFQYK